MKLLHIASALALGLGLIVSAPVTLAAPVQAQAATTAVANTHPAANAVSASYGNTGDAQRAMADWTHVLVLPDVVNATNTASEPITKADPPAVTTVPDPTNAGYIAAAQRAMADWTHVAPLPDTTPADNTASR